MWFKLENTELKCISWFIKKKKKKRNDGRSKSDDDFQLICILIAFFLTGYDVKKTFFFIFWTSTMNMIDVSRLFTLV